MFYHGLYIAFLNSQMPSFKSQLKTYLFKQAYNYNLVYCYIFFRFPFFF